MKGYVITIVSALFIPIVLASTCLDGFCQNGGTCSVFQGKANCSCPSNFTGDNCQYDVDECQVNSQCKNGATCSNTFGGYICSCIFGWEGPDCAIDKDDCGSFGNYPLCFNGGTCVDRIGRFDCICPPGKVGPVCQHDDECFYKPCYGDAICSTDAFGQYSCKCPRGWTGENCSIDIDECNRDIMSPCHHGGTCKNTLGSFACICAPGYTGQQVCVKLVVDTSSASTLLLLSALVSLPTSTPTRISPKPSVVASISLKPELPTRATTTISTASKSLTPEISTRTTTTTSIDKDEETSEFPFQFIWGSVGAFAVLVCVVLIAIAIKQIRRKRKDPLVMERNNEDNVSMMEITPDIMNQLRDHSQQIPIEAPAEVPNSGAEEVVVVDNETYLDQMEIDRNWEIPRERLEILQTKLGGGEFGVVKKGNYLRGDGNKLPVAVKMLKDTNDQKQRMALIQELEMLKKVGRHKNIVSLVGACSFEEPLCVIIEFVPDGSLDRILLESRIPARTEDANYTNLWSRLSERDLLRIAKDVANGMQHLESKLCIHRDLAARNILIGKGLVAKVADFGLSRDISQNGEYIKCTGGRVPWLWMSMESLRGINTTMSDVWSFGVVLWEIVTLGKRPYAGVTGIVELYTMLQDGFRLEKPPHCSKILYDIMLQCWQETPKDRPTFKDLHSKLYSILCEPAVSYVNITHFQEQINEMDEADTLNCFI